MIDPMGLKDLIAWPAIPDGSRLTHLVTCAPRPLLQAALGPISCTTLWLPHGHSDKGQIVPYYQALSDEAIVLVYGNTMASLFQKNGVKARMIRIGSYRHAYYQKRQRFYDALPLGIRFSRKQTNLLYAPTWEDAENNCSFWLAFPQLAAKLPETINLIVKPHPNTIAQHAPQIERLIGQTECGNLQFLLDFPPIYPLLERCDAYLGDSSSIGYDFLMFDRPMFFFDSHRRSLVKCGVPVTPENFYDHLLRENPKRLSSVRQAMARSTFDDISLQGAINLRSL